MTAAPPFPSRKRGVRGAIGRTVPTPINVGRLADRYPFLGPFFYMIAITFFVAQVCVAYDWQSRNPRPPLIDPRHPYSFFANAISDLGETGRFTYGTPHMWSPHYVWMNVAFVLLGAVMILGTPLVYQEFNENTRAKVWIARFAFTFQFLAGVGAILVGCFPENVDDNVHKLGAGFAIGVGTFGVFLLGLSLPSLPARMRRFMLWCMPISLVAILLFAKQANLGFGQGGIERIAAYPEVIWLITFGFYISRSHYVGGSRHRPAGRQGPLRLRFPAAPLLPAASRGSSYSESISLLGGSGQRGSFEAKTLPVGLQLAPDGTISGTPTQWGFHRLKVVVDVAGAPAPMKKAYTLRIRR